MALDLKSYVIGKQNGSGGTDITVEPLTVTENGTYTAEQGKAFDPVNVNVPEPTGTKTITENGTYDIKNFSAAEVNVSAYPDISADDDEFVFVVDTRPYSYMKTVSCGVRAKNGTTAEFSIDWGDGTELTTGTCNYSSGAFPEHTYSDVGIYVIRITQTSGTLYMHSTGSSKGNLFFGIEKKISPTANGRNLAYLQCVKKIAFGKNIYAHDFGGLDGLLDCKFSENYVIFSSCSLCGINYIAHYNSASDPTISAYDNYKCGFSSVEIEEGFIETISDAFSYLMAVERITIPSSLVTYTGACFEYNPNCAVYDMTAYDENLITAVDNVESLSLSITSNHSFRGLSDFCVFLFRNQRMANAAKNTPNLSQYATHIHYVGEETEEE